MSQRDTLVHLTAGGIAGTAGAIVTCPLEVVKTRLQSSNPQFGVESKNPPRHHPRRPPTNFRSFSTCASCVKNAQFSNSILAIATNTTGGTAEVGVGGHKIGLVKCLRLIVEKEGPRALFKGLLPNLVGVAPSRAIYFSSYSQAKKTYNQMFPFTMQDSPIIHICSAATAGFVACSTTNPIWFVKTRLQLHSDQHATVRQVIRQIYNQSGLLGFYKGISASYMGISETVIHFVIYEATKKKLQEWSHSGGLSDDHEKSTSDFLQFMCAGAFSKTVASCLAYPHEVARTRLREEGNKYKKLFQTLGLVFKEEGMRGLYRGLGTQLIRQIPNTAIMMSSYELVVYLFDKYLPGPEQLHSSSQYNSGNDRFHSESHGDDTSESSSSDY